ncbi:MAG: hypothetical protein GF329_16185 [Candidatus Lokiarchaeota archaeon]|nr:hypothetical protein [Candidatus Lokiarchaeota archaeon]
MNIFLKLLIKMWPAIILSLLIIVTLIFLIKNSKNNSSPIVDSIIKNKTLPEVSNDLYNIINMNPNSQNISNMIKNEEKIDKLSRTLNGLLDIKQGENTKDILDKAKELYLDPESKNFTLKQKIIFGWITFWIGLIIFIIFRMIIFSYNSGILIVYAIFIIFISMILFKRGV